jgi:hypothetical protein
VSFCKCSHDIGCFLHEDALKRYFLFFVLSVSRLFSLKKARYVYLLCQEFIYVFMQKTSNIVGTFAKGHCIFTVPYICYLKFYKKCYFPWESHLIWYFNWIHTTTLSIKLITSFLSKNYMFWVWKCLGHVFVCWYHLTGVQHYMLMLVICDTVKKANAIWRGQR